jgi:RND family efflux transporter MFP subunit
LAERDAAQADLRASGANLKNWQAESKVLEADMRRDEELWKAQLVTQQQLEHSRYKFEAARFQAERDEHNQVFFQAKLRSIELELEKTRITAPFDGVVARRYVRAGQKVANNDKLFWVTAMSPISVRFTLPQEFVGHIRPGELVTVSAPGSSDKRHDAKVALVSPVVDPASGTIEVQARLVGAPAELLPGMTVDIHVRRAR